MTFLQPTNKKMDSEDDVPRLSAETYNILQEFYAEQAEREEKSQQLDNITNKIEFQENWQLSQFWYDEDTISKLVTIIIGSLNKDDKVALISCPSLYNQLKERCFTNNIQVKLFEFDKRFAAYSDYVYYDYNNPLDIPQSMKSSFDLVICDPPFLSEECLSKTAITAKFLTKHKIILCTGATMEELSYKYLAVQKTAFVPRHKNNLANEFCCYSNYDISDAINAQ